jgi:hypothetical protein
MTTPLLCKSGHDDVTSQAWASILAAELPIGCSEGSPTHMPILAETNIFRL